MTTMGWLADGKQEQTDDMSFYLPSNLLVTGPDIIFFWVARMIMASLKFTGKIPFRDVYFTSIIRDGKGRKMSKSLGNSPDPLNVIAKYGSDALRFTIVYLAPLGTDVRLEVKEQDVPQVELGRNFANKIWNAGRFLMMKREENPFSGDSSLPSEDELSAADKWIRSRYHSTIKNVGDHLHNYRITEYARTLHEFIWRDFCDWYVEILKSQINASSDAEAKARMVHFAMHIFDGTMRLLHPVMPFISETLWQELSTNKQTDTICTSLNPAFDQACVMPEVESSFELLQMLVEEIRKMRSLANIQNHQKLPVILRVPDAGISAFLNAQSSTIATLGRASAVTIAQDAQKPENALSSVIRGIDIFIETAGAIDQEKEKARLTKEAERLSGLIRSIEGKLNNPGFVSKAPEQVVKAEQEKLESIKDSHAKIMENLSSLG
jgi:valyl-tRNA synthetase